MKRIGLVNARAFSSCIAVFLLCAWHFGLFAAGSSEAVLPYGVRIWQADDGLPQNSVYAIAQTPDGYLWVGTHEGLARFDGLRFTAMDDPSAPELKHGWITSLCTGADGSLWIACDGSGVFRFKNGSFAKFSDAEGLPSNATRCLLEAKDGALWIGTEAGVARYRDGKFTTFTTRNGLGNDSVRALFEDHAGVIRVATMRGLSSVNQSGTISTTHFKLGTSANALKAVCEDRQGNIWVASNEGVARATKDGDILFGPNEGLPHLVATAILEDSGGRVWIGTYNGVACISEGKVVSSPMSEGGFGDLVYTLFEDREENLWVGGRDGLYRLRPARFTPYTTQEGLSCNNVMSVLEDKSGIIWIGTWGEGLNRLQGKSFTAFGPGNGLNHDKVLSLHEGRDGSLWIGMDHGGGVNRLKSPNMRNNLRRPEGLIDAAIRVIHEDRHGRVWIGTSHGLNIFEGGKCSAYTTSEGLPGNIVMVVCEDRQGQYWIGTDGGLCRFENGKFVNLTAREGFSANGVNSIYEDADGVLWIGTKSGGLNRYKEGKFTAYTSRNGLFSDEIYELLEDDFGYFWMSCRNGIFRVSKKDFDDLDARKIKALTCITFGKADGMASVQCNGVAKPSGWKGKDGRLWFPTIRGVLAVQSRIKTNDKPPPLIIEEIFADKKRVYPPTIQPTNTVPQGSRAPFGLPTRLTMPPGQGELEIHYTALSFQAPEKNRFKYILERADSVWMDAGTRREAHYNNLGPGTYRFRLIGCNNDGVWNTTGASLALVFLPHFWQTWWFKLSIPTALALFLAAIYRVRVARLRAMERLRVQIAADLHDDVGSRLTKVAMVTELMDREAREGDCGKPHIRNIANTTREIIQAMDEIVWTINPKNDTLDNLANYVFQYAQEYFQNSNVRCRVDLPAALPNHAISTEERHNLFMAIKEALNNIVKHSGASEARIGLTAHDGKITIRISDNGRGFNLEKLNGTGNGLKNMRERLERIGGRLILESEPGAGTKITLEANGG